MSKGKRLHQQRRAAPPPRVGKNQPADRRLWLGAGGVVALIVVGVAVAAISSRGGGGKPQTGKPADLVVASHQEIAIAAGKPPAHVPARYAFSAGE